MSVVTHLSPADCIQKLLSTIKSPNLLLKGLIGFLQFSVLFILWILLNISVIKNRSTTNVESENDNWEKVTFQNYCLSVFIPHDFYQSVQGHLKLIPWGFILQQAQACQISIISCHSSSCTSNLKNKKGKYSGVYSFWTQLYWVLVPKRTMAEMKCPRGHGDQDHPVHPKLGPGLWHPSCLHGHPVTWLMPVMWPLRKSQHLKKKPGRFQKLMSTFANIWLLKVSTTLKKKGKFVQSSVFFI